MHFHEISYSVTRTYNGPQFKIFCHSAFHFKDRKSVIPALNLPHKIFLGVVLDLLFTKETLITVLGNSAAIC